MARGLGDYARDFFLNVRRSEDPPGRKLRQVVRNRIRARVMFGCCGHRGEPGC